VESASSVKSFNLSEMATEVTRRQPPNGIRHLEFDSRRLHYFSTAIRLMSVPVSNKRIAASSAAGLRCM
jgi:hypothetical protein